MLNEFMFRYVYVETVGDICFRMSVAIFWFVATSLLTRKGAIRELL